MKFMLGREESKKTVMTGVDNKRSQSWENRCGEHRELTVMSHRVSLRRERQPWGMEAHWVLEGLISTTDQPCGLATALDS